MMNLPNWDGADWVVFLAGMGLLIGFALTLPKIPGCVASYDRECTKRIVAQMCIEHPSAPGCKENDND